MAYKTHSQEVLRKLTIDGKVKGFAMRKYRFKQVLTIETSGSWRNYFFREDQSTLSSPAGNNIKGIPRGAEFPQASVSWEQVKSTIEKYGLEDTIPWEDVISDEIDVENRTLIRIAEGVVKSVDDEIWDVLTESQSPSAIQSVNASEPWDSSDAAIFDDLGAAKEKLGDYNYPTDNLICFISPKDQRSLDSYIFSKGAQAPQMGNQAALNGSVGKVNGVTFVVSNSVTASYALVVVPKRCATWKQLVPLQTDVEDKKFKGRTITACEMGVTQLTDPKACVLISGTQA